MGTEDNLRVLPNSTIRLIGSTQVITSVFSVIKELVENSLDAHALSIDIKLEDFGLEKIEISDNGCGVKASDVPLMVKRHFTSKLTTAEDLTSLETYGFRGEALASLCAVSTLSITTKHIDEDVGHIFTFCSDGNVLDKKPSHVAKGTIICANKLFSNLPVRKQYYNNDQRKKDDLKKIENLIMAYSLIKPSLRITLKHGKDEIFQKTALKDTKQVLHRVFGRQVVNQMLYRDSVLDDPKLSMSAFLPKPGSDVKDMSMSSAERTFVFVNQRPVNIAEINRILRSYYSNCHDLDNPRHPICILSLNLPLDEIDVNVDPNKTKVFLQNKTEVKTCLEEMLLEVYGPLDNVPSWHYVDNDSHNETSSKDNSTPKKCQQIAHSIMYTSASDGLMSLDEEMCDKNDNKTSETLKSVEVKATVSSDVIEISDQIHSTDIPPEAQGTGGTDKPPEGTDQPQFDQNGNSYTVTVLQNRNNICDSSLDQQVNTNNNRPATFCLTDMQGNNSIETENPVIVDIVQSQADQVPESISRDSASVDIGLDDNQKDVDDINADTWTRGALNAAGGASVIQPVVLLPPTSKHTPGKRTLADEEPSTSTSFPPKRKSISENTAPSNQPTLHEAFNVQQAKKPESAFELFCREKRSQYEENEGDKDVDQLLKEAWENLSDNEVIAYRGRCWEQTKRYEKEMKKEEKKETTARDEVASLASQSQAQKPKKKLKNRLYAKEVNVSCNLGRMNNVLMLKDCDLSLVKESHINVVGQANLCDAWFCLVRNKLYMINTHRLLELDIYNRLKAEHALPLNTCEPIPIDSRVVSLDLILVLERLARASQTNAMYFEIQDKRLVNNGFQIKCHVDSRGNFNMVLIGICDAIPTYNLSDIQSVLEILAKNPKAKLPDTRPDKVVYYLQGEAVRMMRQSSGFKDREEIQDLLTKNKNLLSELCLHKKRLVHGLIDVSTMIFEVNVEPEEIEEPVREEDDLDFGKL